MPPPRDADPFDPTLVKPTPGIEPVAETQVPATPSTHQTEPSADREATLIPPPERIPTLVPPTDRNATLVPPGGWSAPPPALGGTMAAPTALPASARPSFTTAAAGQVVGRFAIHGLHAKGGLGEVYTARDTELNRDVALKQIQARFADDPGSRRRFLSEAEITARLDHPGVVPVFGLVADGFGRPCYAMRFIRGESLKDEIDRYHGAERVPRSAERGTQAPRSVAFRQLLQRFISVCQAIAYAHTRGVIHRDIKPHNVMVGTFGETLVVDWGLAKVVGDATPERPSGVIKPPAADPDATEELTTMGTAVGTPAYMPPEQAAGQIDKFGPPSDIYSLGATLYCLLTGKAPFAGKTPEEIVAKVIKGEFPRPRELKPEVPKPLEAVALKAMALHQEDRYPDALALAADVERWLSDEPVHCYRDPLAARVGRWARRHPARVAATVSLLIAGFVGVAAGLWLVNEERKNTDKERRIAEDARADEEKAKKAAVDAFEGEKAAKKAAMDAFEGEKLAKAQVIEARDAAAQRSHLALNAFGIIVQEVQDQLEDRAGTQALRQELLRRAQQGLQELLTTAAGDKLPADHTCFTAFARMGDLRIALGETREARAEYEQAVDIARRRLKDHPADVEGKRDLGAGLARLAEAHLLTGNSTAARTASDESLRVRTEVLTATPKDRAARRELAAGHRLAAAVQLELGNTAAALTACRAGLALRQELLAEAEKERAGRWLLGSDERKALVELRRDLAESHDQEADILLRTGKTTAALEAATTSRDLRAAVADGRDRTESQRELAAAFDRLGEVHTERGDMAAALAAFEQERTVLAAVLEKDPRSTGARADLAVAHGRVGFTLLQLGKRAEAQKQTWTSVELCQKLAADDPGSAKALRELAHAHERHGDVLIEDEKPADALAQYWLSADVLTELARKDPGSGRQRGEVGRVLLRIGDARLAAGEVREALEAMTQSLEYRQAVAAADRASARAKRLLFQTWDRLFCAHRTAGNTADARSAAYRALDLAGELAAADPHSAVAKRDLAVARGEWGLALSEAGERFVPLIAWHKALDAFAELAKHDPSARPLEDEAVAAAWLAEVYTTARLFEPAISAANRSVTIRKEVVRRYGRSDWQPHRNLMRGYRRLGDVYAQWLHFADADRCYQDALDVAKAFSEPALLAKEVAATGRQRQVCAAITAGLRRADLSEFPREVRAAALAVVLDLMLQSGHTVEAAAAADGLVGVARGPDDVYQAAQAYAMCAAGAKTESERKLYAAQAVKYLDRAVCDGFRDAGRLGSGPWEAVRIDPRFGRLVEDVRKLPAQAPMPHPSS
jgi:tetratricopeptide (TPR) repeat protein/tRNA A-37 threonylcarbamoyl transferase component Bud32